MASCAHCPCVVLQEVPCGHVSPSPPLHFRRGDLSLGCSALANHTGSGQNNERPPTAFGICKAHRHWFYLVIIDRTSSAARAAEETHLLFEHHAYLPCMPHATSPSPSGPTLAHLRGNQECLGIPKRFPQQAGTTEATLHTWMGSGFQANLNPVVASAVKGASLPSPSLFLLPSQP